MTSQHPITPPLELVQQWASKNFASRYLCTQAARWGADQELEACVEWLEKHVIGPNSYKRLRAARRPQPPSLKEQALAVIENSLVCDHLSPQDEAILRKALEQLPND